MPMFFGLSYGFLHHFLRETRNHEDTIFIDLRHQVDRVGLTNRRRNYLSTILRIAKCDGCWQTILNLLYDFLLIESVERRKSQSNSVHSVHRHDDATGNFHDATSLISNAKSHLQLVGSFYRPVFAIGAAFM